MQLTFRKLSITPFRKSLTALLARLSTFALLMVVWVVLPFGFTTAAQTTAPPDGILLKDGFETGDQIPSIGTVVSNTIPSDPYNNSLECLQLPTSGLLTTSFTGITAVSNGSTTSQGMQLSIQMDVSHGGTAFIVRPVIYSITGNDGYGFSLRGTGTSGSYTLEILKYSGVPIYSAPATLNTATVGTTTTGPTGVAIPGNVTTNGWNNLVFTWTTGGVLSVSLNGKVMVTATDTTPIAPGVLATGGLALLSDNSVVGSNVNIDNIKLTPLPTAPASLYSNTFESGTPLSANWTVVSNPFPGDLNNSSTKSLQSAVSGTIVQNVSGITASTAGQDVQLSMQFDLANSGPSYTLRAGMFPEFGPGGSGALNGYAVALTGPQHGTNYTVQIVEYNNAGLWTTPIVLATRSLPPSFGITTTGWNNLVFTWTAGGNLSFSINGALVLTTQGAAFDGKTGVMATNGLGIWTNEAMTLDNIQITQFPEYSGNSQISGVPAAAAALGYTDAVIDEYPVSTDIAPALNGAFKWFRGDYQNVDTPQASFSLFLTTPGNQGMLELDHGAGVVGIPNDMSVGALPPLSGNLGYYVQYETALNDDNADYFPGVYQDPMEHTLHSATDFYGNSLYPGNGLDPGDATGFERWLELDVDEGTFGPSGEGTHNAAIDWAATYNETDKKYEPASIAAQFAGTTVLERKNWHTFAASFNPSTMLITWYLDGNVEFTSGFVPLEALLQHPIIQMESADKAGTSPTYSQYVANVRVYQAPTWTPAATPIGLTVNTTADGQLTVAWSAAPARTYWTISRSVNGAAYTQLATGLNAPVYADTGLTDYTNVYCYKVTATLAGVTSASSTAACNNVTQSVAMSAFSFEDHVTTASSVNITGSPWTFTHVSGCNQSGEEVNDGGLGSSLAPNGVQVGFLRCASNVTQTVGGLTVGKSYRLTVAAEERPGDVGTPLAFVVNGTTIAAFAPTTQIPVPTTTALASFADYSATFTATAASETLELQSTNTSGGDNTVFIDNVRIQPNVTGTMALTVSPVTIPLGASGANLSASGTFSGATPASEMVFQIDNGDQIPGACSVSGTHYTCTLDYSPTGSLTTGSHTITTQFPGDANYVPSSGTATLTVGS
jgi:hypothetical protein